MTAIGISLILLLQYASAADVAVRPLYRVDHLVPQSCRTRADAQFEGRMRKWLLDYAKGEFEVKPKDSIESEKEKPKKISKRKNKKVNKAELANLKKRDRKMAAEIDKLSTVDVYKKYLSRKYEVSIKLEDRPEILKAAVTAFEDLPSKMQKGIKLISVSDRVGCDEKSLMATRTRGRVDVLICIEKAKSLTTDELKYAISHEYAHAYAALHESPDYKPAWLELSRWKRFEGLDQCDPTSHIRCQGFTTPGQLEKLLEASEGKLDFPEGFASAYGLYSNAEDYGETFAHFRYDADFYERAKTDKALARKLEYMKKEFGVSYEFADSNGCEAVAGDGIKSGDAAK